MRRKTQNEDRYNTKIQIRSTMEMMEFQERWRTVIEK